MSFYLFMRKIWILLNEDFIKIFWNMVFKKNYGKDLLSLYNIYVGKKQQAGNS